ncbi:ABC transporter substrate-binding protein [Streptomyces winkii]|uniref:ABC transporter substrate-binding protein n=1 Tax=Streptomyces winkii TaxID=3051178 RepID=UPI0028D43895|nr:extracellular solute-binding protein [Streptomyces sp. DSM 40971]
MRTFDPSKAAKRVVVLLAVASVLSACGTGPGASSGDGKSLRVQIPSGPLAKRMQEVGRDFEKANPGTKVTFESVDSDSSRGPNVALLSSTATPDIGYLQRSTGVWSALLKKKQLTQIDDVWDDAGLAKKYAKSQSAYYTTNGHHYGVLYEELLVAPIYYNKAAFAKAGIPDPADHQVASVDEFESMVDKLKAAGYAGFGVGGSSPYDLGHTLDALLPTAVSKSDYEAMLTNFKPGSPTKVKYTDPGFVKVLKTIQDWQKKRVYQKGMLGMDTTQAQALFTSGKLATLQGGNYSYAELKAAKPSFDMGWFLLPPLTPGRKTPFNAFNGDTLVVPAKAGNPELAKKFLKFFMTEKYQISVVAGSGSLPVFTSIQPSRLSNLGDLVQEQFELSKSVGQVNIWDSTVPSTLGQAFAVPVLQKLVSGKLTPRQAAEQFQAELEKLQSGKVSGATD